MIWFILTAGVLAIVLAPVCLDLVPPLHASTLLHIRGGAVHTTRGSLKAHAREHVTEILSEARVHKGFIAITSGNRVVFSRHIPAQIRQRLRNVLLNQWAS